MTAEKTTWANIDCRHFDGVVPCRLKRDSCEGCTFYDPMGKRVLIIKLAAMGDVVRTTPILEPIRARHERTHVTWVMDKATVPLLTGVPGIEKIMVMNQETVQFLNAQRFDEVYCLDKDPRAIALSATVPAGTKKGFTLSPYGTLDVHDDDGLYALRLGIDDPFKFLENKKTYQEIVFEMSGFRFNGEPLRIGITDDEREEGRRFLARWGRDPFIGVNTGAGDFFATKRVPIDTTANICRLIRERLGYTPVLLGGPSEAERNQQIVKRVGAIVKDAGCEHPIRKFASIVSGLSAMVCVDTLAQHLAIAEGVPVLSIFGPTCPQEVHLYGRGEKFLMQPWCSPCYKQTCDHHTCMNDVRAEDVVEALGRIAIKPAA
ncbi:glycosyltransferase family 9 protein [bacterium]|nr:glycosyltransferase family 9 protein [bacterium]